jgi:hypothetical protein
MNGTATNTLTKAFAHFDATLRNVNWSCSAIARDGSLVFSGWAHHLRSDAEGHLYTNQLSPWKNRLGANLLSEHIERAYENNLPVRFILVTATDPAKVEAGEARTTRKPYRPIDDLVGAVTEFDGDTFAIEFQKV